MSLPCYSSAVNVLEQQVKHAELHKVNIMPVTVSSITDPKLMSIMDKRLNHNFLTRPDTVKVSLLDDINEITMEIRKLASSTSFDISSSDRQKEVLSNAIRNIPVAFE